MPPSSSHPITKPVSSVGFAQFTLPLHLLTHVAGPVLAPCEVELITLRGSPEVHVKLKAAFCQTGCKRKYISLRGS